MGKFIQAIGAMMVGVVLIRCGIIAGDSRSLYEAFSIPGLFAFMVGCWMVSKFGK